MIGGEEVRVPLEARSHGVHHGFMPGVEVGTPYGIRAHGPWEPEHGLRFNPAKLLVDPYARAIDGDVTWPERPAPGAPPATPACPTPATPRRSCRAASSSTTTSTGATTRPPPRRGPRPSSTRCTSRASPRTHPGVPEHLRGTYAGLAHPAAIEHLVSLGVTAVELLPGAPVRRRAAAGRRGVAQLLGLQHARLLRPARRRTPPTAAPVRRSTSSRGW